MFRASLVLAVLMMTISGAQAASDPVAIQIPADTQTVHLGARQDIPVTVTASSSFSGTVYLSLDLGALSQASPEGKVTVSLNPTKLHLTAGQSAQALVSVKTDSTAPTVSPLQIRVIAQADGHFLREYRRSQVSAPLSLAVDAVYEIRLHGGPEPEAWDSPTSTSFAPHSEGVLVRFINMDTRDSHIIHSEGPIPHQDTSNPLEPAAAEGQQGGVYEYLVTDTDAEDDTYHCHSHESDSDNRTLHFNQPSKR